jgi:hypothetical protein
MTQPTEKSKGVYINAQLVQTRLTKENANSMPGKFSDEKRAPLQVEVSTNSEFTTGLDNKDLPKELFLELNFKLHLKLKDKDQRIATYEAGHAARFLIAGYGGFTDWLNVPTGIFEPYFSALHHIAVSRAENTLLAMGLRGVAIPSKINFGSEVNLALPEEKK